MTLLSTISKWGNGQGIRLPKTLLELVPFHLQTEGGNSPIKPLYIHQIMSYESLFI